MAPDDVEDIHIPLRQYIDQQVDAEMRIRDERYASAVQRFLDARSVIDKRLDDMNKWRESIRDLNSRYLDREYYDLQHAALEQRIRRLEQDSASIDSLQVYKRWQVPIAISAALSLIGLAITIGRMI